jgi:cold shock CspA family protein
MTDDLLIGLVTSFRREQGFGVITLEDGRDVKFDASACKTVPDEGALVLARVGPARWGGGLKALHVELHDAPAPDTAAATPLTIDQQLAMLQGEHLVGALSEHVMAQLVADVFGGQLGDATLIDVIDAFYAQDDARPRHDGYLRHGPSFPHDVAAVLAKIATLVPNASLPHQLAWTRSEPAKEPARASAKEPAGTLHVRLPDGSERTLDVGSLDDIVFLVNSTLLAAGDPRRLYSLDTGGDWHAYLVLTADRARRLANALPFATPPRAVH